MKIVSVSWWGDIRFSDCSYRRNWRLYYTLCDAHVYGSWLTQHTIKLSRPWPPSSTATVALVGTLTQPHAGCLSPSINPLLVLHTVRVLLTFMLLCELQHTGWCINTVTVWFECFVSSCILLATLIHSAEAHTDAFLNVMLSSLFQFLFTVFFSVILYIVLEKQIGCRLSCAAYGAETRCP
jgi:hypothetical protein